MTVIGNHVPQTPHHPTNTLNNEIDFKSEEKRLSCLFKETVLGHQVPQMTHYPTTSLKNEIFFLNLEDY